MNVLKLKSPLEQVLCYFDKTMKHDDFKLFITQEQIGYVYNPKQKIFEYNTNNVANFLLQTLTIVKLRGEAVIYNHSKGIYEVLREDILSSIIKIVLESVEPSYGWNCKRNKAIIESLKASIPAILNEDNEYSEYIAIRNGTINLGKCKKYIHSKEYLLTRFVDIDYNSEAECPNFMKFIQETTCNDKSIETVLQEICGYMLIGNCKAEKFFIWNGRGANGKSVLKNVIVNILGSCNVSSIPMNDFEYRFGLSTLINKLVNIASENESNFILSSDKLKIFTSGEKTSINIKFSESVEAETYTKLVFLTNNLPFFKDTSEGIKRRLLIIPFNNSLTEEKINVNLSEELYKEREGIFRWMVEGATRLISNKYQFSKSSKIDYVTQKYIEIMNPVQAFVKDNIIYKKSARTSRKHILQAYNCWLDKNSIDANGTNSAQKFWSEFKVAMYNIFNTYPKFIKMSGYIHLVDYKSKEAS